MSFTRLLARPLAWAAFTASFLFLLSVTVLAQDAMPYSSDDLARGPDRHTSKSMILGSSIIPKVARDAGGKGGRTSELRH